MYRTYRKEAEALVQQMTVAEQASQLRYDAPAIPRLGIPAYNCGTRACTDWQEPARRRCFRRQSAWQQPFLLNWCRRWAR